jgi:hypothetical protein
MFYFEDQETAKNIGRTANGDIQAMLKGAWADLARAVHGVLEYNKVSGDCSCAPAEEKRLTITMNIGIMVTRQISLPA